MAKQVSFDDGAWTDFEARLRGYVRRRVDPSSVDDVVGGILLRLVQSQEALAKARSPIAWALRVAGNAISDHYRRRATEGKFLSQAAAPGIQEQSTGDAERPAATGELARCIAPLIRSLPEPYAGALLLTDIEGLTQAEAAERLNLSISGVKSRVQRGRRKLKDALLRCCVIETDRRGGVIDYRRRSNGRGLRC
ncbi:sigma-70 family RNA polymerase sigma factor [Pelagibius litoralis]|uniref:Sigma-70 family RNA polymerase sigma factor n=1 Tax=Pelagibius litoralis TaxID=374515 RepID=A0A967C1Y8_9PROT|nr:sigma-70 family RNA polymerase sigma factor [Pelagibius litoralis]NIA67373.1 sigma-70 family RNA polymerase sigma factor [Pelagibius litoralis]